MSVFTIHHGAWKKVPPPEPPPEGMVVIADPPYAERTHKGRRTGSEVRQSSVGYAHITRRDVRAFVRHWLPFKPEWWALFGDDVSSRWWKEELERANQYTFRSVPWCKPDAAPRFSGDGPSSAVEEITVAVDEEPDDPVEWVSVARWRKKPRALFSRQPFYLEGTSSTRGNNGPGRAGSKPLALMRRIVRDYSVPGQLVVDPYCGTGTTLLAAVLEGRLAWGCDVDRHAVEVAQARLNAESKQLSIIPVMRMKQPDMFR